MKLPLCMVLPCGNSRLEPRSSCTVKGMPSCTIRYVLFQVSYLATLINYIERTEQKHHFAYSMMAFLVFAFFYTSLGLNPGPPSIQEVLYNTKSPPGPQNLALNELGLSKPADKQQLVELTAQSCPLERLCPEVSRNPGQHWALGHVCLHSSDLTFLCL